MWDAVLVSFGLSMASEMGDKTQIVAFSMAAETKDPASILGGIALATVLNQTLSSLAGDWIGERLDPRALAVVLGISFLLFAAWVLHAENDEVAPVRRRWGTLVTAALVFFLSEMGDKTQFLTVALAARYRSVLGVTVGTTLGMLVSDGLAVFLGERVAGHLSVRWIRRFAAGSLAFFGLASLVAVAR